MPYYPDGGGGAAAHKYGISSYYLHLVADYTGLSFYEVREMDYYQFLIWRRDAHIYRLNSTEAGREYLDNAWRMEQTEPDRAKLREQFGKGGV